MSGMAGSYRGTSIYGTKPIRPAINLTTAGGVTGTVSRPTSSPTTGQLTPATPKPSPTPIRAAISPTVAPPPATAAPAPNRLNPANANMVTSPAPNAAPPLTVQPPVAPPPVAAAPAQPAGSGVGGTQVSTISGNEVPERIAPGADQNTGALLDRLQSEAMRSFDQPTMWDDEMAASAKAAGRTGIDRNYAQGKEALEGNLAARGINYSSIAGTGFMNLEDSRAQQLSKLDTDIMTQRANSLADGRRQAMEGGAGLAGFRDQIGRDDRGELRQERGYTDNLRGDAQADARDQTMLQEQMRQQRESEWQSYLNQALGYGSSAAGAQMPVSHFANNAAGYGAQQTQTNADLAALASAAAERYGGGAKP